MSKLSTFEGLQKPLYREVLATSQQVDQRIDELASEIIQRYKYENPLFVCLLRGGAPFASKLMFAIAEADSDFNPELDYMTIKTYGEELVDKPPELVMGLAPSSKVAGRLAISVDDVLDKGLTLQFADDYLHECGASDVNSIVLVEKDRPRQYYSHATLYGFEAPTDWLTGMGLDDPRIGKEANRWMSEIAIANL